MSNWETSPVYLKTKRKITPRWQKPFEQGLLKNKYEIKDDKVYNKLDGRFVNQMSLYMNLSVVDPNTGKTLYITAERVAFKNWLRGEMENAQS